MMPQGATIVSIWIIYLGLLAAAGWCVWLVLCSFLSIARDVHAIREALVREQRQKRSP